MQRKHVRAPLKSVSLFVDGEYVLKASTVNISEGGILLSELPHIPEINAIPMMVSLPLIPKLSTLSFDELKSLHANEFPKKIFKVKAKIVRSMVKPSLVDNLFSKSIGCQFYLVSPQNAELVKNYVETFSKNVVYLLSLFESIGKKNEQLEHLRLVAQILGYDSNAKISILRAKVLHDYQSLESL